MDLKKVGILTFHTALNYGAVLQTYALQQFLLGLNINNQIINYRCEFIDNNYKPFFISDGKIINAVVRGVLFGRTIQLKRRKFNEFVEKYLNLTQPYYSSEEIEKVRDKYWFFISGSDQVWSPIAAGFDPVYFLPFAKDAQKYSYAASIGTNNLTDQQLNEYRKRLKGFRFLSVREDSARKLLAVLEDGREVFVHVDPTLLLKREKWNQLCGEIPNNIPNNYLLLFNVEKPIMDVAFAKKIAKERGLCVVYINERTVKKDKDIIYLEGLSPDVFLSLFAKAKIVVTNSFHGTVFSVIFQKEFYVEIENKKQRNVRIEDLLKELKIYKADINEYDLIKDRKIDWAVVSDILECKREDAKKYFMKIVECM